jgi:hypothetical protein
MEGRGGVTPPIVADHALLAHAPPRPPSGPLQWPFVGLAVVLVLFIAATPWLLGLGTNAASSPGTQAIVTVDRTGGLGSPGPNATHIYIWGVSTNTQYAWINASVSTRPVYLPLAPGVPIPWQSTNVSDTLVLGLKSTVNPLLLNVSAEYVDSAGTTVLYYGVYWLNVTTNAITVQSLTPNLTVGGATLPIGTPSSLPLLSRPLPGGSP